MGSRPAVLRVRPWVAGVAALAAVTATTALSSPAVSSDGSGTTSVRQGSSTAPLEAGTATGTTADSTPIDVSVVLKARQLDQLESKVAGGWTGPYLTTAQFAATYGQTQSTITGIENYLHGYGITTSTFADGLDIQAHGTASQFNKAFNVSLKNFRVVEPNANGDGTVHHATVHGSLQDPQMPTQYAGAILAVLGLSNYSPYVSHVARATHERVGGGTTAAGGIPAGAQTPSDFVNRYHLSTLSNQGAKGQGRTIGIVTLASFDPQQSFTFWNKYLGLGVSKNRLTTVKIDGGAGAISEDNGSDESDLDVQQSGAIAPKADLRVYVAANTDPGFADAFFAAASDNIADTVSTSWGESETFVRQAIAQRTEDPALLAVDDEVFAELGAQGQSSFASSGDDGAYDAFDDTGTTDTAIDTPADSPYITGGGGTTLPGLQTYDQVDAAGNPVGGTVSVDIPAERAWGWDYFFPMWKQFGFSDEKSWVEVNIGGDGGGYSAVESRPSYQQGISSFAGRRYLKPTKQTQIAPGLTEPTDFNLDKTPGLTTGSQGSGRGLPDISTNADPVTGYAVYDADVLGGFDVFGGTSFVAPQLNGAAAVIDSSVGRRVGFWNPSAYKAARSSTSPFTPLNDTLTYSGISHLFATSKNGKKTALTGEFSNNNLFYTGKSGAYWNPAVGLGLPDLTALSRVLGH